MLGVSQFQPEGSRGIASNAALVVFQDLHVALIFADPLGVVPLPTSTWPGSAGGAAT